MSTNFLYWISLLEWSVHRLSGRNPYTSILRFLYPDEYDPLVPSMVVICLLRPIHIPEYCAHSLFDGQTVSSMQQQHYMSLRRSSSNYQRVGHGRRYVRRLLGTSGLLLSIQDSYIFCAEI